MMPQTITERVRWLWSTHTHIYMRHKSITRRNVIIDWAWNHIQQGDLVGLSVIEPSEVYAFISTSRDRPTTLASSSILGQVVLCVDEDHWCWPLSLNLFTVSMVDQLPLLSFFTSITFHHITDNSAAIQSLEDGGIHIFSTPAYPTGTTHYHR